MKRPTPFFSIVVLLGLFACASSPSNKGEQEEEAYYTVTKVVDGDTFWVDDGSEKGLKIRLIGVNAPESRNTGRKKKEPFGLEAKRFLTDFLKDKQVKLVNDVDAYDQYGRMLAYVYLKDGLFLNAYLVEMGYAQVATYPPNVAHVDDFLQAQRTAREKKRGLWGEIPVETP